MKINRQSIIIFFLLFALILGAYWIPSSRALMSHGEIRAAMDIGSGSTNLIVAKVDPKTDKIIAKIFEQSIAIPYQKHLEKSSDNRFDQEVINQGIAGIKTLKETADHYGAKKVVAVATAAFRQAANAQEVAKEIEHQTGVMVRIIDQDEEGILAFRGALALTSVKPEHTVVWDIGGGSMQLTTLSKEGTYLIEKGKTASIPFKNYVITTIQHQDIQNIHTPNPMNPEQMQQAVDYAASLSKETSPVIVTKIEDPQTTLLAVGNLFNYGVKPVAGDSVVQEKVLAEKVLTLAGKTDEELGKGSLSEVSVTNPLMVLGYMQGLNMKSVEVVNVNNADGALTYAPYWE